MLRESGAARQCLLIAVFVVSVGCSDNGNGTSSPGQDTSTAALFAPTPDSDNFYDSPAMLPDTLGAILKSRAITYQPAGVTLPNPAWQLQYVTHDVEGGVIAAIATVVKPMVPNLYGQAVLVSFQHAYDSLGADCTPSHTATGSTRNTTNMAETLEFLPGLQTLGWTVVIPDYEGPYHAFGAGALSAQATLDAIRAALLFEPLQLSPETPVAMWGYSGGAYATTWAAALQPQYAKELNLAGVVAGGTPTDVFKTIHGAENTESFSLLLGMLFGTTRAYPELLPAGILNDQGRQALALLRDSCEGNPTDGSTLTGGRLSDYVAADDPYLTPGFQAVDRKVNLLQSALSPTADVYLYHEINDTLVPIENADKLAARWCQDGTPLSYYRSSAATAAGATPVGTHTAGAAVGTPASIAYLDSRFSGSPAPTTPPGSVRCN